MAPSHQVATELLNSVYHIGVDNFFVVGGGGGRISLAEPDPYARGEGLVTCYTRSCSGALYRAAPIRLQLHWLTIVTRLHNIAYCH